MPCRGKENSTSPNSVMTFYEVTGIIEIFAAGDNTFKLIRGPDLCKVVFIGFSRFAAARTFDVDDSFCFVMELGGIDCSIGLNADYEFPLYKLCNQKRRFFLEKRFTARYTDMA